MCFRTALLLILLVLLPPSQQEQNQLSPVISDLSIVARLINGISVQSEFMRSSQNLNAVVGELLGIGDSIPELLKVKVKDLMNDVQGVIEDVKNVSASSIQDLEAIGDALRFLRKIDKEKLKKTVELNLTTLQSNYNAASRVKLSDILPDKFLSVVANLKYVLEIQVTDKPGSGQHMLNQMNELVGNSRVISDTFRAINDEALMMKKWEDIMDTKSKLQDFPYLVQVLRKYLENMVPLSSLHQSFRDMKARINKLKPIIQKSQASSATNQTLGAMTLFSSDKLTDKKLTAGFHNGIGDLKMLFDDLNGEWLKENVADGKDMKMMVTALEPLKKFYENLKPLETSWGKMREDPETGKVVGNIAQILKNGKILNPDELTSKSGKGVSCMKMLKGTSAPDLQKFDSFFQNLDKSIAQLKLCKESVDKVTSSPHFNKISGWRMPTLTVTTDNMQAELDNIRNDTGIQEMSAVIIEYVNTMKTVDIGRIEKMFDEWREVSAVRSDVSGTGLVAAFECLNKINFDFIATETFYRFDQGIQNLKTQNNVDESMKMFEEAIDSLISSDKKVKETVDGMKVSRRRRRSAQGPLVKGLLKLADSGKVAQDLGNAVQALREMNEVFENQGKVLNVAKSVDSVDTVIQGIPEMDGKWTADNKKALEKLVDEVNTLNLSVGKDRSLKEIWERFREAQSVSGAPMKGRILGTLVFKELEKSSDPNVKAAAGDFKEFPPLHLDFTGSKRTYLRDASMILPTITAFFKDFFAIDTSSSTQSSDSSPNYLLFAGAGAGALVLVAALGVGGYLGFKIRKNNKMWKDRERYWLYMSFEDEQLIKFLDSKEVDKARQAIKKGAYVNSFENGLSCLHVAVKNQLVELVELLIRNGADMTALSYNMKTPEFQEVDEKERDEVKTRKIKAMFKKYKGKTFKQKIPKLMPYNQFSVYTGTSDISAEFRKMYEGKVKLTDRLHGATHLVVDVDKEGVYQCKKEKMAEFFEVAFGPSIAVSPEWANQCAKNALNFHKDYDFRVTKVKFNGKVYTNVDKLKEFARGRHISFGMRINVSYVKTDQNYTPNFGALGFETCSGESDNRMVLPVVEGIRSFYRPDLRPNFIVCAGESIDEFSSELEGVELKDYTVMTLDHFFVFLLEMKMTGGKRASQFPIKTPTPTSTSKTDSTSKATSVVKSTQ